MKFCACGCDEMPKNRRLLDKSGDVSKNQIISGRCINFMHRFLLSVFIFRRRGYNKDSEGK